MRWKTHSREKYFGRERAIKNPAGKPPEAEPSVGEYKANVNRRDFSRGRARTPASDRASQKPEASSSQPELRCAQLQKQMRSGPATRTALFWQERSVCLLRAGRGQRILRRVPKNAAQSRAGQRICKEPKLLAFPLQHHGGQRPVPPFVEDSLRRPQRPGNHHTSIFASEPDAFLGNPPDDSPSRIIRIRRLCRHAGQNNTEHLACLEALCLIRIFASSTIPPAFVNNL